MPTFCLPCCWFGQMVVGGVNVREDTRCMMHGEHPHDQAIKGYIRLDNDRRKRKPEFTQSQLAVYQQWEPDKLRQSF